MLFFFFEKVTENFKCNQKVLVNGLKNENFVHYNGKIGKIIKKSGTGEEKYVVSIDLENGDNKEILVKENNLETVSQVTQFIYIHKVFLSCG